MSTISLRLPDSLHRTVRKLAEQEQISINLITVALAEKISVLMTEDYPGERAKRGSRAKPHLIQPIETPEYRNLTNDKTTQ